MLIPCQRNIVEGKWDVSERRIEYFEMQDSTLVKMQEHSVTFESDGTGFYESSSKNCKIEIKMPDINLFLPAKIMA